MPTTEFIHLTLFFTYAVIPLTSTTDIHSRIGQGNSDDLSQRVVRGSFFSKKTAPDVQTDSNFFQIKKFLRKKRKSSNVKEQASRHTRESNISQENEIVVTKKQVGPGIEIITPEQQMADLKRLVEAKKEYENRKIRNKKQVVLVTTTKSVTASKSTPSSPVVSILPTIYLATMSEAPLKKTHLEGDIEDIEKFTSHSSLMETKTTNQFVSNIGRFTTKTSLSTESPPSQFGRVLKSLNKRQNEMTYNPLHVGSYMLGLHRRRARHLPKWEGKVVDREKRNPCKIALRFLDAEFKKNLKRKEALGQSRKRRSAKQQASGSNPCRIVSLMNSAEKKKQLKRRRKNDYI